MLLLRKMIVFIVILMVAHNAVSADIPSGVHGGQRCDLYGDPLPDGCIARMGSSRLVHGPEARVQSFSDNGQMLATGVEDDAIRLWSVGDGSEILKLSKVNRKPVRLLRFLFNDTVLASAHRIYRTPDWCVGLWDVASGKLLHKFGTDEDWPSFVAVDNQGKTLIAVGRYRSLWDIASQRELLRLESSKRYPSTMVTAVSPDNAVMACGEDDGAIRLFRTTGGEEITKFQAHQGAVICIRFSPDGKFLCSGGENQCAAVWDAATGQEVRRFQKAGGTITSVEFSRAGASLVAISDQRSLQVWDIASGQEKNLPLLEWKYVSLAGFSAGDEILALHHRGEAIFSWDLSFWGLATGNPVFEHSEPWAARAFSPDAKTLAVSDNEGPIRLLDMMARRETYVLPTSGGAAFSPDGRVLAVYPGSNVIDLWDVAKSRFLHKHQGHLGEITAVRFLPNGKTLVSGSRDGTVRLWETATGREIVELSSSGRMVTDVALSLDGRLMAAASIGRKFREPAGNRIDLWDAATGRKLFSLEGHEYLVMAIAFSADATRLVSVARDATIRFWDLSTGEEACHVPLPWPSEREWEGAVFTPNANTFGTYHAGTSPITFWGAETGTALESLKPRFSWRPSCVAFSSEGRYLATAEDASMGERTTTVHVLDTMTGDEAFTLEGHERMVSAVAFSDDTRLLASAGMDMTIRLWDMATGEEVKRIDLDDTYASCLAFSPDGKALASGMTNTNVLVWDIEGILDR